MPATFPEVPDKSEQRRQESEPLKNLSFICETGAGPKQAKILEL